MSFQIEMDPKSAVAGRFVGRTVRALKDAFVESGLKQQDIAVRLDIHRSVVNRRLQGKANLTLRSLAEMAWAMDLQPEFLLEANIPDAGCNHATEPQFQGNSISDFRAFGGALNTGTNEEAHGLKMKITANA